MKLEAKEAGNPKISGRGLSITTALTQYYISCVLYFTPIAPMSDQLYCTIANTDLIDLSQSEKMEEFGFAQAE